VLYNEFIESKIKIQFIKSGIEIERNQDLYEEQKEKFYSDLTKFSSSILFENDYQKLEKDLTEKEEKRIIKYGVIVAFKNGIPTFLHQSFAELFLAQKSLQKIIEQNKDDQILEQILREERHFLIRKFLNDLMGNYENQKEKRKVNIKNEIFDFFFEDFSKEIENCCRENLISLLKYFIDDKGAKLNTKNRFVIIASHYGHKDIVAFLLEKGIDVNQQVKRSGSTALTWASKEGHKEIVRMLLQDENIQINQQDGIISFQSSSFQSNRFRVIFFRVIVSE
jgi:hypothetical protein